MNSRLFPVISKHYSQEAKLDGFNIMDVDYILMQPKVTNVFKMRLYSVVKCYVAFHPLCLPMRRNTTKI